MEYNSVGLTKLKDDELITVFIKRLFGITNIFEINNFSSNIIQDRIKLLKLSGIKSDQLARLTGISKKLINNV